jgi:hypothetical protein
MPTLLIVEKSGNIKELNVKQYVEEDLYKKAGFKSDTGFKCQTTWNVEIDQKKWDISVFAKTTGRAGQENKYDFPPPVDSTLFFGSCILVAANDDLRAADWEKIYEFLFGGFEDIGTEDSEEEEEDEDDDVPKTKDGYVKDGFIVDDSDDTEEQDEDDGDDEDDTEEDSDEFDDIEDDDPPPPPPKPAAVAITKNKKSRKTVFDKIEQPLVSSISSGALDCTCELVEEEYV